MSGGKELLLRASLIRVSSTEKPALSYSLLFLASKYWIYPLTRSEPSSGRLIGFLACRSLGKRARQTIKRWLKF